MVTLQEDLRTLYCYRRHKFAVNTLLWNTQYFYIFDIFSTTHTECIVAFPLQQLLRERATMLRYTYIAYLVIFAFTRLRRVDTLFVREL